MEQENDLIEALGIMADLGSCSADKSNELDDLNAAIKTLNAAAAVTGGGGEGGEEGEGEEEGHEVEVDLIDTDDEDAVVFLVDNPIADKVDLSELRGVKSGGGGNNNGGGGGNNNNSPNNKKQQDDSEADLDNLAELVPDIKERRRKRMKSHEDNDNNNNFHGGEHVDLDEEMMKGTNSKDKGDNNKNNNNNKDSSSGGGGGHQQQQPHQLQQQQQRKMSMQSNSTDADSCKVDHIGIANVCDDDDDVEETTSLKVQESQDYGDEDESGGGADLSGRNNNKIAVGSGGGTSGGGEDNKPSAAAAAAATRAGAGAASSKNNRKSPPPAVVDDDDILRASQGSDRPGGHDATDSLDDYPDSDLVVEEEGQEVGGGLGQHPAALGQERDVPKEFMNPTMGGGGVVVPPGGGGGGRHHNHPSSSHHQQHQQEQHEQQSVPPSSGQSISTATQTHEVRMPMYLPTFKPATGCTNASDFIVRCFVARLRSGITVVKHGRSRWCKSRLRVLHIHPDGRSLSWKPAEGEPASSRRPPKLDLSTCLEVRHAWSPDPQNPMYTGTQILRQKCEAANAHKSFALIFKTRTVDITAVTADQCKVLMEGFSALCFRLQVANLAGRNGSGAPSNKKNAQGQHRPMPEEDGVSTTASATLTNTSTPRGGITGR